MHFMSLANDSEYFLFRQSTKVNLQIINLINSIITILFNTILLSITIINSFHLIDCPIEYLISLTSLEILQFLA